MVDAKPCECHGEPMVFEPDSRYRAGGFWRCRVILRERQRARYGAMSGVRYNRKLLLTRRNKALARMRKRHEEA